MYYPLATIFLFLTSVSQVLGHYRFTKLLIDGVAQPEFKYIRQWTPIWNNSPVTSLSDPNLRCYGGSPSPDVATIRAGASVGFVADSTVGHPGPFLAYLSKSPGDVKSWDGSGQKWFKIWEKGATSITDAGAKWDDSSKQWIFKIPQSTPSGQYLLRFEHIGLHGAGTAGGAQFYISCAQINVVNGGNGKPGPLVAFPGAYKDGDKSVVVNIYWPVPKGYVPPGPAVWRG